MYQSMCVVLFSLQKRHNADSVVNKKECQGIQNSFPLVDNLTLYLVSYKRIHVARKQVCLSET